MNEEKNDIKILKRCPMCFDFWHIELMPKEYLKYRQWRQGIIHIQDIHTLTPCEREFLKTGVCKMCQYPIFANNETIRLRKGA